MTDAASNVTIHGYDTENNLVDITDAANRDTHFTYDALGRVTQVTFPSTLSESYAYDAMNNLLSKTDRKQQTIGYGYDALYRLTRKTYPDQTAVGYAYDPLSRLTQVTDPSGAYSFTYDNLGRLLGTGTQYSFLSTALNNSYAYDAASNRASFTNPQSQTTNYTYDSLNRLTALADPNTGSFTFGYDALGRRTSLARPNGVDTSYSYDTLSRLLSVLHNGGALPGSTGYTYDAAGNRTSKTAVQEASPNPVSVLSQYSYDNIYELTQAVVNGSATEGYSYDAVGNRLSSAGPTSYNYNSSNELTSTSSAVFTYDNNGNTASKTTSAGTTNYTWDFENRLTSVTLPGTGGTVYFKYDPFGRRIYKSSTAGTTIYAYDGDNVTEELGTGGNLVASYTQGAGIDEPLAMTGTSGTYFYHSDGLGSITSLTNGSGQLVSSYVYDSFGQLTGSTGTATNPFRYTGREFDSETGLYYYRARYYDPAAGRFITEDPIGFTAGNNFYSYVQNAAADTKDPSGLAPAWWNSLRQQMFGAQISDCVRDLLKQYFPQLNFDKVRLYKDVTLGWIGAAGLTNGYDIAYDPMAVNGSVNGIQNLAHELVHVGQFAREGKMGFYYHYVGTYIGNRMSMDDDSARKAIPEEKQAYDLENKIESDLMHRFGAFGQPCKELCK